MERFFAIEGKFFRLMSKIGDLMILNFMWLIASLPVITVGASTTALFSVTMKMTEEREGEIVRSFWKFFSQNLGTATVTWMLFLTLQTGLAFMAVDNCFFQGRRESVIVIILWMCELMLLFTWLYIIPVQACGLGMSPWKTIRYATLAGVLDLPWSVAAMAGQTVIGLFTYRYTLQLIPIWLMIGVAVNAYLLSFIFNKGIERLKKFPDLSSLII